MVCKLHMPVGERLALSDAPGTGVSVYCTVAIITARQLLHDGNGRSVAKSQRGQNRGEKCGRTSKNPENYVPDHKESMLHCRRSTKRFAALPTLARTGCYAPNSVSWITSASGSPHAPCICIRCRNFRTRSKLYFKATKSTSTPRLLQLYNAPTSAVQTFARFSRTVKVLLLRRAMSLTLCCFPTRRRKRSNTATKQAGRRGAHGELSYYGACVEARP